MINTLFLRLEGPMQSWGERARWSIRDTATEPTKSGVVGLLACALGWNTDEDLRRLSQAIRMGVRCDRPGQILVDYHTIVDGVLSAEGKLKINASTHKPETVLTKRSYLWDASFLVVVQSSAEWIDRVKTAVQAPVWPVYLGRKSCPPTRPVFDGTGEYDSLRRALERPPYLPGVRAVIETEAGKGSRRRDEINSRRMRTYLPRYIEECLLDGSGEMP